MAYSWQQRRPLSIPDHTLLAIRHMLFSSDERRTTDEEDGHFEHPASRSCTITIHKFTVEIEPKLSFSASC